MEEWDLQGRNSCYTYFRITGDFDPDRISDLLGLLPERQWRVGDKRKNGTVYDFALWEFGRCTEYDVIVDNQMRKTIGPLLPKAGILKEMRKRYHLSLTLEIVPSIYVGDTNPCLAPSAQVVKFCCETGTELDIDLFVFDSYDGPEIPENETA